MVNYPDLKNAKLISVDVETKDPDIKGSRLSAFNKSGYIVGFSIGTDYGFREYVPLRHLTGKNAEFDPAIAWLKDIAALDIPKVGANLLYDMEWLALDLGIELNGPKLDVQVIESLLDENKRTYKLDALAVQYLDEHKVYGTVLEAAAGMGVPEGQEIANLWRMSVEDVYDYGVGDADLPIRIIEKQIPLIKEQGLEKVYDLESRLIDVLHQMRLQGVRIDYQRAYALSEKLTRREFKAVEDMNKLIHTDIDVWAADSISKAADKLGLLYPRTKNGVPSFVKPWMEHQEHDFWKLLLDLRSLNRANKVFVKDKILEVAINGRIHPQYYSTKGPEYGTSSGRLSSANPNVQQIPARDPELGKAIRSLFIPEDGEVFEVYDYSQQEPRTTVHYAEALKLEGADVAGNAFRENPDTDYHKMVALIADIPRKQAKDINLGLAYGMGLRKLCNKLGVDLEEGNLIIAQYHRFVPYMKPLMKICTELATNRGFVRTILGRRRRFNQWGPKKYKDGDKPMDRAEAAKKWGQGNITKWFTYRALNAIIQGTAADMTKTAMVDIYEKEKIVPVLSIHDELDFSNGDRERSKRVRDLMVNAIGLSVPLKVDYESGPSWGECEEGEL